MLKKNLRRGGYIAPYSSSPNSTEYMLNSSINHDAIASINYANNKAGGPEIYVPPSTASPVTASTPGIRGGSKKMELNDVFYYSMEGGCACNSGGSAKRGGYYANEAKKGGDFVLTPFISALALLGARMLADKNSGFNMNELMSSNDSKTGGRRRQMSSRRVRGGTGCARNAMNC
jgi:hypothetical protein